jgi:hypothetical protein
VDQLVKYGYQAMTRYTEEFAAAAAASAQSSAVSQLFTGVDRAAAERQHAQAVLMLSQIKARYAEGKEILSLICRNVDFAQIQLQSSLYSGSENGYFRALVKDILAQAPLHVQIYLARQLTSSVVG